MLGLMPVVRFGLFFAISPILISISGCSSHPQKTNTLGNTHRIPSPSIDTALGEKLQPNESILAEQISEQIGQSIRKQYTAGHVLRDAHPKAHGCVRAEFHVSKSLPSNLAKGIFIPDKTYSAWIRFSNASGDATQADNKKDARGMAIKILGVTGKKIMESDDQAMTQDFIMINHPVFFVDKPDRYLSFIQNINSGSTIKKLRIPFVLGFQGTMNAIKASNSNISNPIQTRYWSMVPYQLGLGADRQVVKYSARLCSQNLTVIPDQPSHDFLREALRNSLQQGDACMEFLVQPRTSNKMLVEDSMTEWKEAQAPFYPVATIHIPQQIFDTPEQNRFCENLSFTPWHSLPEHRPLGAINRLRKVIYENISTIRHEMNAVPKQEPQ
ncbi:catalase family protein [Acinetobacter sp. C26M]|uniref:catalase family protein n=1 Tax=unclassified Acinetobacter TaxID=196816 RepID=UPI0020376598|nr:MULTISPECIES: catalase family protein [unclassified Acinetobacter]USA45189.1 catalase family protein [Acinetobacter sp. C26M]USA48691.1 catalase family protein [Acinetobacter sp. C26G]